MQPASDLALPVLMICGLLLLATGSLIWLKRIRLPYTVGLVVIGMLLAELARYSDTFDLLRKVPLTHDLIMYVLLPVLIFDAAINMKASRLFHDLLPVMMLAVPGVLISMLFVGFLIGAISPLTLTAAMLFGALISATDPVAVIALFKELGAPKRLSLLMDAESLFNDATAIVIFGIVLSMVQVGSGVTGLTVLHGVWSFMLVFFGGILVGGALAWITSGLLKIETDEPFVQLAHTTLLAYGSFVIADHLLEVSGVMSTIAAGLVTRNSLSGALAGKIKEFLLPYWEFMAFLANSLIFILLGIKEDLLFKNPDRLMEHLPWLLIAVVVVLISRVIVVYSMLGVSNQIQRKDPVDRNTKLLMFWGGLRGVVPVALMLSLPADLPQRMLIVDMTLAVILFSLLMQGTSISWLMKKLEVKGQ
ncbi:hypothetical protein EOPP23_04855 [Endozoicomonas sp. OPT23]|uniref:cation:proton antiporter n=1 Tax=Endozoicomonas sp. OPT23 TaxID=2072845 RepID=UPI00129AFD28|nr:cation:proton antiporter [Endozoicomonas sp. OPT23]MRI32324.1 hypothetical protein [Endozoicomonas sp. OPT23]